MPMPRPQTPVTFSHACRSLSYPRAAMARLVRDFYRRERIPACRIINVILCTDPMIRRLNSRFRGIDRPTDVLTFPFGDPDLLGEIYISLPRCKAQSREYGLTYHQEVLRMFVHGLVHLLGHDHHTPAQRRRMETVERKYFHIPG